MRTMQALLCCVVVLAGCAKDHHHAESTANPYAGIYSGSGRESWIGHDDTVCTIGLTIDTDGNLSGIMHMQTTPPFDVDVVGTVADSGQITGTETRNGTETAISGVMSRVHLGVAGQWERQVGDEVYRVVYSLRD